MDKSLKVKDRCWDETTLRIKRGKTRSKLSGGMEPRDRAICEFSFVPYDERRNRKRLIVKPRVSSRLFPKIVSLDGRKYQLVRSLIGSPGKAPAFDAREAVVESTEDGAIDYERLTSIAARMHAEVNKSSSPEIERVATGDSISSEETDGIAANLRLPSEAEFSRQVVLKISGILAGRSVNGFSVDWYGGGRLVIDRANAVGDWDLLETGQWIEATVLRSTTGEVLQAMLVGVTDEPERFSEEDLTASYSAIPAAKLEPMEKESCIGSEPNCHCLFLGCWTGDQSSPGVCGWQSGHNRLRCFRRCACYATEVHNL